MTFCFYLASVNDDDGNNIAVAISFDNDIDEERTKHTTLAEEIDNLDFIDGNAATDNSYDGSDMAVSEGENMVEGDQDINIDAEESGSAVLTSTNGNQIIHYNTNRIK